MVTAPTASARNIAKPTPMTGLAKGTARLIAADPDPETVGLAGGRAKVGAFSMGGRLSERKLWPQS
jgi:hypothetical protein